MALIVGNQICRHKTSSRFMKELEEHKPFRNCTMRPTSPSPPLTDSHSGLPIAIHLVPADSTEKRHLPQPALDASNRRKRVRFNEDPAEENNSRESQLCREELDGLWWTADEMMSFQKISRRESKEFRRKHPEYSPGFRALYQDCIDHESRDLRPLLLKHAAMFESPACDMRGLERQADSKFRRHRYVHTMSVLKVQDKCFRVNDIAVRRHVLRQKSVNNSRESKILARVLALADSVEVAMMLQSEQHSS